MRTSKIVGLLCAAGVLANVLLLSSDADACGGCFSPQENPTVVTDHRMIFSISKTQSTLYDQIKYTGAPESFAWVLPYSGEVNVGLSADVVFAALDQQTQTVITAPPRNCPPPPSNCGAFGGAGNSAPSSAQDSGSGVTVLKTEVVGPYEIKYLHPDNPNDNKLNTWLTDNKYVVPADVAPVIAKYQSENFNFLALRLVPGKGVQDMRPVRVTTQGANVALPLRMVAAGTGPVVGITLWVISEGRYEPQNFPSFTIKADELSWDWTTNKSNYTDLRAQKTTANAGKAWEVESSQIFYRQQVEGTVKQGTYNGNGPYPQTDEERAAQDYVAEPATDAGPAKTAAQVRDDDLDTLFYGIATSTSHVSRYRADLAHSALDADLLVHASTDQSELPRFRQITKSTGQPICPVYSGCEQIGTAPRDQVTTAGPSAGGSTFTCAAANVGSNAWLGVGFGMGAVGIAYVIRRRRRAKKQS